ncbi:MAG: protein-disulfide reductase DsbD domain-containing protein, partial [Pseudomonadota bacterium]
MLASLSHLFYLVIMTKKQSLAYSLIVSMFFAVSSFESAQAASSDWQDLGGGKARLIASVDPKTGVVSGAVEVQLEPGWSTYWRYPGSSGIPPRFDFSASKGFTIKEVEFPTPKLVTY